jgi:acid stress chaperone HdeB
MGIQVNIDALEDVMTKLMRVALTFGLMLALNPALAARAQVTLDMSKVTCDQFTGYKITNPQNIAIWLSGYHSGTRGNTIIDTQGLLAKARELQDYCLRNPQTPVMQAAETLLGARK